MTVQIMYRLFFALFLMGSIDIFADNMQIYEYKNANGVTVFTNNPEKIKNGAKLAPISTLQIYSGPSINRGQKNSQDNYVVSSKENLSLNNDGRRKILMQEYDREMRFLKAEEDKLTVLKKNKTNDKQQIKEISDNIIQHRDNIEILQSQIRK